MSYLEPPGAEWGHLLLNVALRGSMIWHLGRPCATWLPGDTSGAGASRHGSSLAPHGKVGALLLPLVAEGVLNLMGDSVQWRKVKQHRCLPSQELKLAGHEGLLWNLFGNET